MRFLQYEENEPNQGSRTAWRSTLPEGEAAQEASVTPETAVTPEVEDARRRFILALRAMTVRKTRDAQNQAAIEEWSRKLKEDIDVYRRWRGKKRRRRLRRTVLAAVCLYFFVRGGPWWIFFIFGGAEVAADATEGSRKKTVTDLARTRDPRAVNALAIACRDGDKETQRVATEGLNRILPWFQASDAEFITTEGMEALIALLRRPAPDLVINILKALEQVGDQRAIPVVEGLASGQRGITKQVGIVKFQIDFQTVKERVQTAAQECLRYLHARVEKERQRSTLLRPAQSPTDPSSVLLRPAGSSNTADPDTLLRPASSED